MGHGIKLGQVYSNPFVNAFKPQVTEETQDHEVGMAQGQLDYIIKAATELKQKLGNDEKEIPGWIQDHISKAHSYIHQANSGYHEYGDEESVEESTTKLNEQNPSFNKWLLKFVDDYISGGEFSKGSPQFQWALSTLLSATLTDANFHKAAKKAKSIFRRAEEPNGSDNLEKLLNNKASEIAKKAKWDGHDIIDGFAYVAAMRIGGPVMQNVTALKNESVKSSTKLTKLIGKNK